MRRYLALIAAGVALCAAAVRAQEDPAAGFQEARRLMKEALQAKVASERASLEARQKYEQALSSLKALKLLSPNWNAGEVSKAAEECGKALAHLSGDAPRPAAPSKTEPADGVVGHRKTKKFHRLDCRYIQKTPEENRVLFPTAEEAVAAGYTPCKSCKPDEGAYARALPASAVETAPAGAAVSGPFFGIPSSMKVHRSDCKWSRKVADKNKVFFASCADAVRAGYAPCKLCRPDEAHETAAAPAPAPAESRAAGETGYVAGRNGRTFHRADCPWAKGIDASTLVTYKTREEAVAAGKKPCRICKP